MSQKRMLEESTVLQLDFLKIKKIAESIDTDVIPVIVQDYVTHDVLLLGYTNDKALAHTISTGIATFWSTSRNELWVKGMTSGNTLEMRDIRVNCEQNSLLYLVEPRNGCGTCHTKEKSGTYRKSCFYRSITNKKRLKLKRVK